ncbi:MAG: transglutaminase-like domain-containing protein [Desulfarculus sp.]|nr:transglutaminase-like domain-containing protein [Pseudomonadota bacterium]MBV1714320.1 transglutaminase-like domain-containing protein [Desulfarculus sp.]MBV1737389.1 transglutaminase-like domain-containing protein [Desulfarculus sp.]
MLLLVSVGWLLVSIEWPYYHSGAASSQSSPTHAVTKPAFETRVDHYSPADRAILLQHLHHALSRLKDRSDQFQVAAAINSYLYQYLFFQNAIGDSVKILRDGHAICGGTAMTLSELLYVAGIRSRQAFLLGIPYQGNHSLVEVYFRNGTQGLFDPTFGVLWYDPHAHHPVSMAQLLANPALSDRTLYKTIYHKRSSQKDSAVVPIRGFASGYCLRLNYSQASPHYGGIRMDWRQAFQTRRAGGIADGHEVLTVIPMQVGDDFGQRQWNRKKFRFPWIPLALTKDYTGRNLAWAYQVGHWNNVYNIAHAYQLSKLVPGKSYVLRWIYAQAAPSGRTGDPPLMQIKIPGAMLQKIPLVEQWFNDKGFKPKEVQVQFTARHTTETIALRVRGSALFQKISLGPVADTSDRSSDH